MSLQTLVKARDKEKEKYRKYSKTLQSNNLVSDSYIAEYLNPLLDYQAKAYHANMDVELDNNTEESLGSFFPPTNQVKVHVNKIKYFCALVAEDGVDKSISAQVLAGSNLARMCVFYVLAHETTHAGVWCTFSGDKVFYLSRHQAVDNITEAVGRLPEELRRSFVQSSSFDALPFVAPSGIKNTPDGDKCVTRDEYLTGSDYTKAYYAQHTGMNITNPGIKQYQMHEFFAHLGGINAMLGVAPSLPEGYVKQTVTNIAKKLVIWRNSLTSIDRELFDNTATQALGHSNPDVSNHIGCAEQLKLICGEEICLPDPQNNTYISGELLEENKGLLQIAVDLGIPVWTDKKNTIVPVKQLEFGLKNTQYTIGAEFPGKEKRDIGWLKNITTNVNNMVFLE